MEWWFMKTILRNERGFTLAIVLMMMVVLLSITGAGLLFSSLNVKATANLKGGTAALQAADAGIQHALAATPAGGDFVSFWTGTGLANFPCRNSSAPLERAMERHINPRLPARLTVTVTPWWLRTIQLLSMRQRPTISIKSSFLLPRQRVLVAQTERLGPISGDPRGSRRGLFTFQGTLQTSPHTSMAPVLRLKAMILMQKGPHGRQRRYWETLRTNLLKPLPLRVLEARSPAASMVRLP